MKTAYDLYGPDNAPVLVLIHGLGLTRGTWNGHLNALSRDYRVLTYDLCGHGQSQPPVQTPSLTVFSDQLAVLMEELNITQAAIVGFSLGGMINRRFALDYPDKVSALVILNSPHERSPQAQRLVEERAAQTNAGGPGATLETTLARWFTPEFLVNNRDTIAQVSAWVIANEPVTYTQCRQVLAHGVKELIRPNPPITKPTLVMTCENDSGSTPAMSHAIAAEIAGAETVIVSQLQHMGLVECPEQFTTPILDFFGRRLGRD